MPHEASGDLRDEARNVTAPLRHVPALDGVPDSLHYEGPGTDLVARWLLSQLGEHLDDSG
jgi:hypothetical protein